MDKEIAPSLGGGKSTTSNTLINRNQLQRDAAQIVVDTAAIN